MKALGFLSWSSAGLVDDIRVGTGGQELGGIVGTDGRVGGRGVGEWKADRRERCDWVARNSSAVGMSCSRVREELSLQARVPADCCWGMVVSSSSSSEGKNSDDGWF